MKKIVLAALLTSPLLASAVDLVNNGSFESPTQSSGTWSIYSSIPGWTSIGAGIEVRDNVAGTAFDGTNFVELDSNSNSSMLQTLTGDAGQYVLSFWYSARPNTRAGTNGISFSLDGVDLGTVLFSTGNTTGSHNWQQYTGIVDFDGQGILRFNGAEISDSYGGSIDNVQFTTAVPEPETYALMLAGLGVVGFAARRRKV